MDPSSVPRAITLPSGLQHRDDMDFPSQRTDYFSWGIKQDKCTKNTKLLMQDIIATQLFILLSYCGSFLYTTWLVRPGTQFLTPVTLLKRQPAGGTEQNYTWNFESVSIFPSHNLKRVLRIREEPGNTVQSLCQLNRWRRTFESSVTIASRSFSGFHSAILT